MTGIVACVGERLEIGLRSPADGERVEVAGEDARRVLERLAARELQLRRVQRERRAAELLHRHRERDARARRRAREEEPERAPGEQPVLDAVLLRGLQLLGEIEHEPQLVRVPGRERRQVAARERARDGESDRAWSRRRRRAAPPSRRRGRAPRVARSAPVRRTSRRGPRRRPARARRGTGRPPARAPRRRRSRGGADRRRRRRAARGSARARRRARRARRARRGRRAASRRAASCPPAGRVSYASGRPFTTASRPASRPIAVPALPRASSATSGLSFCGIIDEPVAAVPGRRTNPNSDVHQRTISSPMRERCVNSTEAAYR